MRCSSCLVLLLMSARCWASGEFIVAAGVEGDTADGLAVALFGDLAVGDNTWLSAGAARSRVDVALRNELETWYGDVGIDHYFDPLGVRLSAAYWGDNSVLDSRDLRASMYVRGGRGSLALDYEFRDFQLEIPATEFFAGRTINFDASGYGLTARADLGDTADVRLKGIRYDYSVNLRLDPNRDIANLFSATRLSLINTLVDYRASVALGFDFDLNRLEFEVAQWRGAVAGSRTNSYSLRYLTPVGERNDIEFALGYDDSENYGQVTVFSIYLYFYGGT